MYSDFVLFHSITGRCGGKIPWMGLGLAAAAGYLGFTHPWGIGALVLLPLALRTASCKIQAFLVALVFSGVALRGLWSVQGIPGTSLLVVGLAWFIPSVLAAIPYVAVPAFPRSGYVLAVLVSFLPPFAFSATASPLILAGYLFPGSGFLGLAGLLAFSQILLSVSRFRGSVFLALLGLGMATGQWMSLNTPQSERYVGIQTRGGNVVDRSPDGAYEMQESLHANLVSRQAGAGTAVFPEAVGGKITPTVERRLARMAERAGQSYLTGAVLPSGEQLVNAVLKVTPTGVEVAYRQRVPAPYFMWTRGGAGYRAFLFDSGPQEAGEPAFLLCYEIALPWRVLQNHLGPVQRRSVPVQRLVGRRYRHPGDHAGSCGRLVPAFRGAVYGCVQFVIFPVFGRTTLPINKATPNVCARLKKKRGFMLCFMYEYYANETLLEKLFRPGTGLFLPIWRVGRPSCASICVHNSSSRSFSPL